MSESEIESDSHDGKERDGGYRRMLSVIHDYPDIFSINILDELLQKTYDNSKLSPSRIQRLKGLQEILRYIKSIQEDVKKYKELCYFERELTHIRYNLGSQGDFPIKTYIQMVKWLYKVGGKRAARIFITGNGTSNYLKFYTPNSWVDIRQLKDFARKHKLDGGEYVENLDDEEFMLKYTHRYEEIEWYKKVKDRKITKILRDVVMKKYKDKCEKLDSLCKRIKNY
jgi:hypothetical protein